MPTYRFVEQLNVSPDAPSRSARSSAFSDVKTTLVSAPSLTYAALKHSVQSATSTQPPRLVSVEEVLEVSPDSLTDDALIRALTHNVSPIEIDAYSDVVLAKTDDLSSHLRDVADALRESGLIPGISLTFEEEGYVMVEIHDQATATYRAAHRHSRELAGDATLTGREAFVSIARSLVHTVVAAELL